MSAGYLPPPPRSDAERNALAEPNLNLVRWLVRRFLKSRPRMRPFEDDLFAEGCLGLLRAAELFDPAKGRFTTVAYYWVLQKLRRFAAHNDAGAVRVPAHVKGAERARLCRRGRCLSLSRPLRGGATRKAFWPTPTPRPRPTPSRTRASPGPCGTRCGACRRGSGR